MSSFRRDVPARRPSPARHLLALGGALALVACGPPEPNLDPRGAREVEASLAACESSVPAGGLRIDTLATGLEVPWDVAFLPDGRALFTERPGRIRMVEEDGTLREEPWAELDVYARDEVGLMGIDVAEGPDGPEVYVSATFRSEPDGPVASLLSRIGRRLARLVDPEAGHPTTLRILRLEPRGADGTRGGEPEVVVEGIPSFLLHGGGALRVGPDGMLWVSNGDAADHASAQVPEFLRGKILRYGRDGSVPASNPMSGSPVWALGIRHVQGLAWEPRTGALLAIDHGPSGMPSEDGRTDRDELNVVQAGDNLGWPVVTGMTEGGPFESPIHAWTPALAPAGLEVWDGPPTSWQGSAFVTGLRGTSLRRVALDTGSGAPTAACEEVLLASQYGRLRLVRQAPDGTLWLGTSNQDGRGLAREGHDLLLRLHPPEA